MRQTTLDKPIADPQARNTFFNPAKEHTEPGRESSEPLFFQPALRPKATENRNDNKLENEADSAADTVTNGETVQRAAISADGGKMLQLSPDPTQASGILSGPWEEFAIKFNREFKSVLHVFKLPGEPAVHTKGIPGEKSGNDVPAERLKTLFTETQRIGLMNFMLTKEIPSRIFNVGEQWNLTAQQRLLLSAHILSTGEVQPGNFMQRLHARMCFHWAQLTHHYAGATSPGLSENVMGNFDHEGNLVFGNGRTIPLFKGERVYSGDLPGEEQEGDPTNPDAAKQAGIGPVIPGSKQAQTLANESPDAKIKVHRARTLSYEMLETIQPGDWIWVYNGNASPSGGHSVLFSRWASGEEKHGETRYRKAVAYSQAQPSTGGREHRINLGGSAVVDGDFEISPVTYHQRAASDGRPATTVEELLPGNGAAKEVILSQKNTAYLAKIAGKGFRINLVALMKKMHKENLVHIAAIGSHLDVSQIELLYKANETDNMETMIRLTQKLRVFENNVKLFDKNTKAEYEGTEADPAIKGSKAKKGLNEQYGGLLATFESQNKLLEADIKVIDEIVVPIQQQIDTLKTRIDLLTKSQQLTGLVNEARHWLSGTKESRQERSERYKKTKAVKKEIRALRQEITDLNTPKKRNLDSMRKKLVEKQIALQKTMPFGLAHPGNVHGMDNSTISGKLERIYKKDKKNVSDLLYPVEEIKVLREPDPNYTEPPKQEHGKKK